MHLYYDCVKQPIVTVVYLLSVNESYVTLNPLNGQCIRDSYIGLLNLPWPEPQQFLMAWIPLAVEVVLQEYWLRRTG